MDFRGVGGGGGTHPAPCSHSFILGSALTTRRPLTDLGKDGCEVALSALLCLRPYRKRIPAWQQRIATWQEKYDDLSDVGSFFDNLIGRDHLH